jgi:hypothetical protein
MVKFITTISFGCEIQRLIAVLTLWAGFHAFYITTPTSSPPAKETIYPTLDPRWGIYFWFLLAEGMGGVLGNKPSRQ